jgi:hypothetical protein
LDSVYTVWDQNDNKIFYKRNTLSFDPTVVLNGDFGNKYRFSAVAASGNNVYVVWTDERSSEIMYKRSTDGGADFGFDTINLSNTPRDSAFPAIAASGNNVYVVWVDTTPGTVQIMYKRSTDGGASFGNAINLSNSATSSYSPAIAASGNNVYVVWSGTPSQLPNANEEIFYKRSINGGASFIFYTFNLSLNSGHSMFPAIAASGNNVYVVWVDTTPGTVQIMYKRSTDGGASFGNAINLSNSATSSYSPAIAASGNNVYVVWSGTPSQLPNANEEIFYKRSINGGASFIFYTFNLSLNSGHSMFPAIAASGNNVYVVWVDTTPGNIGVLYKRSTDGGANFGSAINISYGVGGGLFPDIAAVNNIT